MAAGLASAARSAINEGNASDAAWAMASSERFRALAVFKSEFSETVFMAQSARRLVDFLGMWDAIKTNDDERFWQKIFAEHSYAISQLFSVPVTFIQQNAHVGGMNIDGNDARFWILCFLVEIATMQYL